MFLGKLFGNKPSPGADLTELKALQLGRDNATLPQVKELMQDILTKLQKKPVKTTYSALDKASGSRIFTSTQDIYSFIEKTLSMMVKKEINTFGIIAAPSARECWKALVSKGVPENEMAVITPDMDEAAEREAIQALKQGMRRLVIADPNRLDFKWNLGDMKAFAERSADKDKKSQVFLFLVEPESMTSLQIEQAGEIIDKTGENGNFSADSYNKDILVLASAVCANQSEVLRSSKKPEKSWEIDDVLNHLPKAIHANDCKYLQSTASLLLYQNAPSAAWQLVDNAVKLLDYVNG
jgi:hypothetical protein